MAGVPAILLDQVAHEAPQAGMAAIGPAEMDELVEPAVGQGGVEPGPGSFDGVLPERVELFGGVVVGGVEVPVGVGVPVDGRPTARRAARR